MAEKKNYWTQAIGTQDALVQFGGIGLEKDVTSSFKVVALDGRHYYAMDQDGTRPGYTTLVSPGVTQIQSGEDVNPEKIAIFVNAISGDIDILAENGNINMVGKNINIKANQALTIEATTQLDMEAKDVNIKATCNMHISASTLLKLESKCVINFMAKFIAGVSIATEKTVNYLNYGG